MQFVSVPGRDPLRLPTATARALTLSLAVGFIVALGWSSRVKIDISASANGRIVPSHQIQVVQNLEGGIVNQLLVHEGDAVKAGQVVARIQNTEFSASLDEVKQTIAGDRAEIARLTAETEERPLVFPPGFESEYTDLVAKERKLFESRQQELTSTVGSLQQEAAHARNDRNKASESLPLLRQNLKLARQQLAIIQPQVRQGLLTRLEELNAQQRILEAQGKIDEAEHGVPAAGTLAEGAENRIKEARDKFRSEALNQLTGLKVKLGELEQQARAHKDRVARRDLKSPVNGVVKKLHVNTIGEVVRPGDSILEIVPSDDQLMVEAKVSPKDIAFVHQGQPAFIRITAYDSSIYGALPAVVEQVSADATVSEREREEVYYLVRVKAVRGFQDAKLALMPGMVAQVDVVTGQRTVFDYLVKPITKLTSTAMHER